MGQPSRFRLFSIWQPWSPFLERPGKFSGAKANFEIKSSWTVAKFLAHKFKPINFASKIYLFLTPSKTDGRVPSQQGAPTTCSLTYWEVSQQTYVQTLLATLGVAWGRSSALQLSSWGWRGEGRFLTNNTNNTILDTKSPQKTWIVYYRGNLSFQGHISSSKSPSQHILRNRSIGCPWK